ncbi:hypothetical protein ACFVRU_49835, partial [Streptomyces sp. NPDC057927]
IYTCTTAQGTLTADAKGELATEITRIHAEITASRPPTSTWSSPNCLRTASTSVENQERRS